MSAAERYLELCLRLRRHDEDFVDAYFGPADLAQRIEVEPLVEPEKLAADARSLAEADSPYVSAQARGLEILARKLAGEEIGYAEEVEGCYGLRPKRVPEERFEEAHRELDAILPPGGTLAERHTRWRESWMVPEDKVPAVLQALNERLRERTRSSSACPRGSRPSSSSSPASTGPPTTTSSAG